MKFGICAGLDKADVLAKAGVDFFETAVVGLNGMSQQEFDECLSKLSAMDIKCEVLNILFPGEMVLIGENRDAHKIREYLESALVRPGQLGVQIIVFGSGKARTCPEGFPADKAWEQLAENCRMIAEVAEKYNITIAMEPLNTSETNMVNSLADGLKLVKQLGLPNFKLLADFYHMRKEDEGMDAILECGAELVHTHIATKEGRNCPQSPDEEDYQAFFAALKQIGYSGRMSVEGAITDLPQQSVTSLGLLRDVCAKV